MDFSKLPKLSESPGPQTSQSQSQSQGSGPPSYATPVEVRRASRYEYGLDAFIALIVGGIFLVLGINYLHYLIGRMSGKPFYRGDTWTAGEKAGQLVEYFELSGAVAWADMGFFVLGAASIVAALLLLLASMSPRRRRGLLMIAIVLGVIGALANVVSVIMMMKVNITPMISMIAILVGGMLAFFYGRHLVDEPAPVR